MGRKGHLVPVPVPYEGLNTDVYAANLRLCGINISHPPAWINPQLNPRLE